MLTSCAKLPFSPGWCYHPRENDLLSRVVTPSGTKGWKFACRGIPAKYPFCHWSWDHPWQKGVFSLGWEYDPWQKVEVLYKPRRLPDPFPPNRRLSPLFLCHRRRRLSSPRPSPTHRPSPAHRSSPTWCPSPMRVHRRLPPPVSSIVPTSAPHRRASARCGDPPRRGAPPWRASPPRLTTPVGPWPSSSCTTVPVSLWRFLPNLRRFLHELTHWSSVDVSYFILPSFTVAILSNMPCT
jgi:hypothetical protein